MYLHIFKSSFISPMTYPPVWKRIINETINRWEHKSKEDKEIDDSDYHLQADFEDEGDEEISGED
jgi:hypothetical protein